MEKVRHKNKNTSPICLLSDFYNGNKDFGLVTMALIESQAYIDLEDDRTAQELWQENIVDWDYAGCRESVNQLLLVVECIKQCFNAPWFNHGWNPSSSWPTFSKHSTVS